eukprot:1353246-Lingulodinium_polyedra.AAC.1
MPPPLRAPGGGPGGWASGGSDSGSDAGGPLLSAPRDGRGASSDSDPGSDSDQLDDDPPVTDPC